MILAPVSYTHLDVYKRQAWEILGGLPCSGLCGYVEDITTFQLNKEYNLIIEKSAENLYRTISQKIKSLPTSNQAVKQSVLMTCLLYTSLYILRVHGSVGSHILCIKCAA